MINRFSEMFTSSFTRHFGTDGVITDPVDAYPSDERILTLSSNLADTLTEQMSQLWLSGA